MKDEIILYTIHCPKCIVLEKKLKNAGIEFSVCEDEDTMIALNIDTLPVLKVGDKLLEFGDANEYIENFVKEEVD